MAKIWCTNDALYLSEYFLNRYLYHIKKEISLQHLIEFVLIVQNYCLIPLTFGAFPVVSQFGVKYVSEISSSKTKSFTLAIVFRPVTRFVTQFERRSGYSIPVAPLTISILRHS